MYFSQVYIVGYIFVVYWDVLLFKRYFFLNFKKRNLIEIRFIVYNMDIDQCQLGYNKDFKGMDKLFYQKVYDCFKE